MADNLGMSVRLPDYYALLHVDPAAPGEVIRASYRTLMQQLRAHPDLGGDHEAAAQLNAAYATLKDPARRAQYDAQRVAQGGNQARGNPRQRSEATPPRSPAPQPHQRDSADSHEQNGATGVWVNAANGGAHANICPFCGAAASRGRHGVDSVDECHDCAAPLTIVRSVGGENAESQRSVYRIAKAEALRVYTGPEDRTGIDALVHDISLSGMRFSCAYQFSAGALIRVDCEICAAVARVAHVSQPSSGTVQYGAEFLTVRFKRQRGSLLSVPA